MFKDGSVYMKDYFQEFHRLKHKTRDDALLADVIVEMKQKKEMEERRNRIEKTKEYYMKVKKEKPSEPEKYDFSSILS